MTPGQLSFIRDAARYLESPTLLIRLSTLVGRPVEAGIDKLPENIRHVLGNAVQGALRTALSGALMSVSEESGKETFDEAHASAWWSKWTHTAAAGVTGAMGGFFGAPAMLLELPLSTGLMMRSMAEGARKHGFDAHGIETQMECLALFAYSGEGEADDAANTAYFLWRAQFGRMVSQAAAYVAEKTAAQVAEAVAKGSAPQIVQLISRIAARFEIAVGEKFFAQAVPVVGALGGGAINVAFAEHFGSVAMYHFGMKRLEVEYGKDVVQDEYKKARKEL